MAELIDLVTIDLPDCRNCEESTKYISGRTMDVEGPGQPGVLYSCENRKCRERWNKIAKYIMRQEISHLGHGKEPK